MFEIEWESNDSHRGRLYNQKYSTVHGWVTKMRGTLFDNEHVRRQGIKEMKAAKGVREYKRKRASEKRARGEESSGLFSFLGFGGSKRSKRQHGGSNSRSRHGSTRTVIKRGTSSRSQKSGEPYLHVSHRVKPHHYGNGTKIVGHITQNKDLVAKGGATNQAVRKERDREKQRRQRQRERDTRGTRRDATKATRQ